MCLLQRASGLRLETKQNKNNHHSSTSTRAASGHLWWMIQTDKVVLKPGLFAWLLLNRPPSKPIENLCFPPPTFVSHAGEHTGSWAHCRWIKTFTRGVRFPSVPCELTVLAGGCRALKRGYECGTVVTRFRKREHATWHKGSASPWRPRFARTHVPFGNDSLLKMTFKVTHENLKLLCLSGTRGTRMSSEHDVVKADQ